MRGGSVGSLPVGDKDVSQILIRVGEEIANSSLCLWEFSFLSPIGFRDSNLVPLILLTSIATIQVLILSN